MNLSHGSRLLRDEQYADLLCTHAVYGLAPEQQHELDRFAEAAAQRERESMERAAAAAHLAFHTNTQEPLPASLRVKLNAVADGYKPAQRREVDAMPVIGSIRPKVVVQPSRRRILTTSRIVAAASLGLLAATYFRTANTAPRATQVSTASDYQTLLTSNTATTAPWADWDNPEIRSVTGQVVWSETKQRGYMVLKGLPKNDAKSQQYQLWIIDRRGLADPTGQSARISGGVFDMNAEGEAIIPITPAIPVQGAAAFAITIEAPGGTWVSTMQRRVAIASLKS